MPWALGCNPALFQKKEKTMSKTLRAQLARYTAVGTSLIATGSAFAQATNPADGVAAVTQVAGNIGDYGPVMFGLAVVSVGVMIGVKWIKRARGAA